jgi:tetratricopeptide (TPR) repeat protein
MQGMTIEICNISAMHTDDTLQVSGCEKSRILMERSYVSVFRCGICTRMVSLDCVVSECCNQPFCIKCFDEYQLEVLRREVNTCPCPLCYETLSMVDDSESKQSDKCRLSVKSLQTSQPLAFKLLELSTITCLHDSCAWTGIYSDFMTHILQHNKLKGETSQRNSSGVRNTEKNETMNEDYVPNRQCSYEQGILDKSAQMVIQRVRKVRSLSIDTIDNAAFNGNQSSARNSDSIHWEEKCCDDESFTSDMENLSNGRRKQLEAFGKAEKLKKQANAKFNAKNFLEARRLYSDGIKLVECITPSSDENFKLLSDMYSNRAATFYRDKKFNECIEDCECAIRYEPTTDKSWIRKWRALSAKGNFHQAYKVLGEALTIIPDSIRIKQEYECAKKDMDTLILLQSHLLDTVDQQSEKLTEKISSEMTNSENVLLLSHYAKVMVANADTENALKVLDIALEINPAYIDCLELKGLCHFFDGAVEYGIRLLTEAYEQNECNAQLLKVLTRLQKTYEFYAQAQMAMESGRHEEANEVLSAAIQASDPLPAKSVLFRKLRTDRASNALQLQQYLSALQDCKEVIDAQREYAPIWIVRTEILMSLGKVKEARKELKHIRKSWGFGDVNIASSYNKVDFEFHVLRAHDDVELLQYELESGTCDTLPAVNFSDIQSRRTSHTKAGRKTDGLDPLCRRTSHSKREKRCDELPIADNQSESLSRKSSHTKLEKSTNSNKAMAPKSKNVLYRKSSFHEKHNNSNHRVHRCSKPEHIDGVEHAPAKSSRLRRSSSKSNSEMDHTPTNPRKPPERRNSTHSPLYHAAQEVYSDRNEAKITNETGNTRKPMERRNPSHCIMNRTDTEMHRGNFVAEMEHTVKNSRKPTERNALSQNALADVNGSTEDSRTPPERRKATQLPLCRDGNSDSKVKTDNQMIDKLVVRKQVQRSKTLDGIFGCDWRNDTTDDIPARSVRPATQRSKSSDLGELRKSLSVIYSKSINDKV